MDKKTKTPQYNNTVKYNPRIDPKHLFDITLAKI